MKLSEDYALLRTPMHQPCIEVNPLSMTIFFYPLQQQACSLLRRMSKQIHSITLILVLAAELKANWHSANAIYFHSK